VASYKVIGFNKASGSITISFAENMAPISVDIPLNEMGVYITGDELDSYIQGFIPTWHLERVNKITAGIPNESDIEALVELPESTEEIRLEESPEVTANIAMWQQLETERQIAKVLVKFGLLAEDPTVINMSTL